jgi:hypothetical protein
MPNPVISLQPNLDYLFPKPVYSLGELPDILYLSFETVWRLYESGQISGHSHHTKKAAADARGTALESDFRYRRMVTRESLIAYMVRTADYDATMQLQWAQDVARPLNAKQLLELARFCTIRASSL